MQKVHAAFQARIAELKEEYPLPNKKSIAWLYAHIRRRLPGLCLLSACKVLCSCLSILLTLVIQSIIDYATAGEKKLFLRSCAAMLLVIITQIASGTYGMHLQEQLEADLGRDFKQDLMHDILRSDYSSISQYHSGDLVFRLNSDVSRVITSVLSIASMAVSLGSGLIAAFFVLYRLDASFTVIIFAVCAILAVLTLLVQQRMKDLYKKVSEASGKVSAFLQEVIEKLLIVQALDVTPEIEQRCDDMLEERWQIQRKRKNVYLAMYAGSNIMGYVGAFISMVWCATKLLRGEMTFGTLTAMTSLVSKMEGPLLTLPKIIPRFITIFASVERLMEIDTVLPQAEPIADDAAVLYENMRQIAVHDLSFSYPDKTGKREPVINGASFNIPKGGLTVITGASGIGKSTLLKLLLGIYVPDNGELLLDMGERKIPVDRSSRKLFSYAPQGNLLLSGTIRENVLLSRPEASEAELKEALYVSAMDEYISQLPNGVDTVLGENGAGLSEGQVQRISLARAVISGAPILLLDEVTSSLDMQTEKTVLERICALPNRTCIAFTHRPAALELADYELHVEENSIVLKKLNHNKTKSETVLGGMKK